MAKLNSQKDDSKAMTPSGSNLIENFQIAQITLAASAYSKFQAVQTEEQAIQLLSSYKKQDDVYVSPKNVPETDKENLSLASLDAHLQKVQANQIENYTLQQIDQMDHECNTTYVGHKARVALLEKNQSPFRNRIRDNLTKTFYYTVNNSKALTGIIKEINLKENYIIVKPTLGRKLVNKTLEYYYISVINPRSLQPFVNLSLI